MKRAKVISVEYLTLHELAIRLSGLTPTKWETIEIYRGPHEFFTKFFIHVFFELRHLNLWIQSFFNDSQSEELEFLSSIIKEKYWMSYSLALETMINLINEKALPASNRNESASLPLINMRMKHDITVSRHNFLAYIREPIEPSFLKYYYGKSKFWGEVETDETNRDEIYSEEREDVKGEPILDKQAVSKERLVRQISRIICDLQDDQTIDFYCNGKRVRCTPETFGGRNPAKPPRAWFTLLEAIDGKSIEVGMQSGGDKQADTQRKRVRKLEHELVIFFNNSFELDLPDDCELFENDKAGGRKPYFSIR